MTPAEKELIDLIIKQDEGGWVLTASNESDPSGGYTFAGVTASAWREWRTNKYPSLPFPETYSAMAHYIAEHFSTIHDEIYAFYYDKYLVPLQRNFSSPLPNAALYSCSVNCGVEKASDLWQLARKKTKSGLDILPVFCKVWQDHYVDLVVANAIRWHDCVVHGAEQPKTFRAPNLQGWLNRVNRYWSSAAEKVAEKVPTS